MPTPCWIFGGREIRHDAVERKLLSLERFGYDEWLPYRRRALTHANFSSRLQELFSEICVKLRHMDAATVLT